MSFFAGFDILPIEICPWQVASIVADDNSIDVEHGYYPKDKVFSEISGETAIAEQKIDDVLDDIAAHGFAGVNSRCQKDSLLLFVSISDLQIIAAL